MPRKANSAVPPSQAPLHEPSVCASGGGGHEATRCGLSNASTAQVQGTGLVHRRQVVIDQRWRGHAQQ
eukprot:2231687-Prymnesium_polylepis.1